MGFLEREFTLSLTKESVTHCSPTGEYHPLVQANWRPNSPGSVTFKHMKNLGTCPTLISGKFKNNNSPIIDPIYQAYAQETGDTSIEKLVGCRPAIHSQERYIKSIQKCDKPRLPRPTDLAWEIAGEYTRRMFDYQHNNNFSMIYDINMSSSVGKPYSSMGFKSKAELLASPIFSEEVQRCHTPLWSIFPKEEYLPYDEVMIDEKLRTIFNPELPFLFHQKFYFDEQNHRMKKYAHSFRTHWPRYGFIKQFGGFNRLCLSHELAFDDPIHFTIDVSGYDRDVCLTEVYDDRTYFLFPGQEFMVKKTDFEPGTAQYELCTLQETIQVHYKWVVKNTTQPSCCLNDGTMFQRLDGNCSGSNNTTVDNCWSHTRICFYLYLRLGIKQYGRILTYQEILRNVVKSLYGDDILGTLNKTFWFPNGFDQKEFEIFVRETYALLRLTVKEKAFKISTSLEGLEFLGSTAQWNSSYGAWVPKPRLEKLTTSITQMLKSKSPDIIAASLTTFFDLTALGQSDEEKVVQTFLKNYSRWLLTNYYDQLSNETDIAKLMDIRDGRCSAANIVLGLENCFDTPIYSQSTSNIGGFSFFPPDLNGSHIHRKEVGFKKYNMNNQLYTRDSYLEMLGYTELLLNEVAEGLSIRGHAQAASGNYIGAVKEYQIKSRKPEISDPVFSHSGPSHIPVWTGASGVKCGDTWQNFEFQSTSRRDVNNDLHCAIWATIVHESVPTFPKTRLVEPSFSLKQVQFLFDVMRERVKYYESEGYDGIKDLFDDYFFIHDGAKRYHDDLQSSVVKAKVLSTNPYKKDLTLEGIEPNPGPLTKAQWLAKNKIKLDNKKVSNAERDKRYQQYVSSIGSKPMPARNRNPRPRRVPQGGSVFNSMAAQVTRDQIRMPIAVPHGDGHPMSRCARLYAVALVNPFSFVDATAASANAVMGFPTIPEELPCVPSFPSLKSRRLKCFSRSTFTCGSDGNSQVAFAPRRLANNYNNSVDNMVPLILYSNVPNPGGTTMPQLDTGGALTVNYSAVNHNSDFDFAEASSPLLTIRLVAAGVRIRYAGADIYRSGIIHGVITPGHQSLSLLNLATAANYETYFRVPVSKRWTFLTYSPTLPAEYQYDEDVAVSFAGEDSVLGGADYHFMGMYITGANPGSIFEFETVHIIEVVGPTVRDLKPAESDMRGLELVNNVVRPETQLALNMDGSARMLQNIIRGASMLTNVSGMVGRVGLGYAARAARKTIPLLMG